MFELKLYKGSEVIDRKTCDVGDLLPSIATLLQDNQGAGWEHQQDYAVRWVRVRE